MGDAIGKEGGGMISEGVLAFISSWSVICSPNLSACHRCGLGFPCNRSADRLKPLDSLWRVVLLCQECFARVRSAQVCSYCFSWFPELEKWILDCNMCSRRVHRACVSLHHRNFSHSLLDADNFICVDCCPIPQLRREDLNKSGGSTSRTAFRVSLEDLVKGATPISEKKATTKSKARENEAMKVVAPRDSSGVKRKAFDAVHLAREPSYINLSVPDEKAALRLHQSINGSKRISRSSSSKGVNQFTVPRKEQLSYNSVAGIIDSNSCTHHCKIEVGTENKSLLEDRSNSESISTNSPLFKPENGDLMKEVRGCNTGYMLKLSLDEMEGSLKLPDCTDNGRNTGLALLPFHSFNTRLMSTMSLTKFRFGDRDGEESSNLQRRSIDAIGPDGLLKKYFRKSWGSGRITRDNSHSILSNGPLFKQENGDLMKQRMVCSTGWPGDFSFQEKEISQKIPDSIDDDSNANSTLLPCHSLKFKLSVTRDIFTVCDRVGYSKLQRKSIDSIFPGRPVKKYFRKHWDLGRISQGNSHPILTNSPLFKRNNWVLMKQARRCIVGCSKDFFLKEEGSLKFPDSTEDVCNTGPALLSCNNLNTWSNNLMALIKYRFGDGERSSKLQRKSIDAIAYWPMKKYFRKHWSTKKIMKGNSEAISVNNPLTEKESEDLLKQIRECNTGCRGGFSLKEKVSSLQFPDSTNGGSNTGSALLPCCQSLSTWPNSTIPLTGCSFCDGDGEKSKELQRKPIDAMVSDNMKKYYRKRRAFKRVMQENSQSISANSSLFKPENGDLMKQTRGCNPNYPGDVSLEGISLNFSDFTDDCSNFDSALLQFHGLNSTMRQIEYRFSDGDGEGCSKLQRRSIGELGSDGSLKKYFRKHLGS